MLPLGAQHMDVKMESGLDLFADDHSRAADSAVQRLLNNLCNLGFVHCSFSVLPHWTSPGKSSPMWFQSTFDPEFLLLYLSHLAKDDPTLEYCRKGGNAPMLWGDTEQFSPDQQIAIKRMQAFGLTNGICLPYQTRNTSSALNFCFEGNPSEHLDQIRKVSGAIFAIGSALNHLVESKQIVDLIYQDAGLSCRQIELLKRIGACSPDKIIADRMSITLDGLYHHKREIKRKLGVRNLNQAAITGFYSCA